MRFKNTKGELSTEQIVLLIILIVSFVIILFFLFALRPGQESKKEVCHQSVVLKGNVAIPTDAMPLKCETNYLCITKDGTCEGLTKPSIEKVNSEEEIYDVTKKEEITKIFDSILTRFYNSRKIKKQNIKISKITNYSNLLKLL